MSIKAVLDDIVEADEGGCVVHVEVGVDKPSERLRVSATTWLCER